jgi:hypothetical protein
VCVVTTAAACYGQSISLGVIGGARTIDDLSGSGAITQSRHYVVGPLVEIGLPLGFAFEADALYRREGYQSAFGNFAYSAFTVERSNSWEFPLLAKYRLPVRVLRPFAEVGYAPRLLHGSASTDSITYFDSTGFLPQPIAGHFVVATHWPATQGIVVGGGAEFHFGRLKLAPAIRYTQWNKPAITGLYGDGPSWQSSQNQLDVLVGVSWKLR